MIQSEKLSSYGAFKSTIYRCKNDIKEIDFEEDIDTRVKICDFGNCCKRDDHIIEEIQTRQYRSPEVIIDNKYVRNCSFRNIIVIVE